MAGVPALLFLLDLAIITAAALSGVFWWLASRQPMRRIHASEELNRLDLNRMIVTFNRTQALNRRGAVATSVAGALGAVRLLLNLV